MIHDVPHFPLGDRLTEITFNALKEKEIKKFTAKLVKEAKAGRNTANFEDLRNDLGTMISTNEIWAWLNSQNLIAHGGVDSKSGKWVYIICWNSGVIE